MITQLILPHFVASLKVLIDCVYFENKPYMVYIRTNKSMCIYFFTYIFSFIFLILFL